MSDYALKDVLDYVNEYLQAEGAKYNRALVLLLANQALRTISSETKFYESSWVSGTTLTLTGNTAAVPTDCIAITAVEYDGNDNPLTKYTTEDLDRNKPGWRDDTGEPTGYALTPTSIILTSAPTSPGAKLVVRGIAKLADFSDAPDAVNPLSFIPAEFQLLPAYYVLGMLPITTADRIKSGKAAEELQLMIDRRNTHAAMWDDGIKKLREIAEKRKFADAEVPATRWPT
jgi:hypothetical protein